MQYSHAMGSIAWKPSRSSAGELASSEWQEGMKANVKIVSCCSMLSTAARTHRYSMHAALNSAGLADPPAVQGTTRKW